MMVRRYGYLGAVFALAWLMAAAPSPAQAATGWHEPRIPGTSKDAVILGRDLDGDGDPDEVTINLEVIEVREEVYPGKVVTFWVFAPEGEGMVSPARFPSPTIRVEQGDRIKINLRNTHYFPHTIHPHGTIHPNAMDGVPDITQAAVKPGEAFTYEFIAKNPGTFFYHCHVQPDVHVLMGLQGMFIIEPNRPNNNFRHLIVGAGEITDLAVAQAEQYDREYSLVYTDIDDRLNDIPARYKDPRRIEKKMHREYDSTRRHPNIFMLNGRSFPFTLRDTLIKVKPNERIKLRILNAGARVISLHTHGHHPILTHVDGYPVPEAARLTRDVFTLTAAQRIDLELRTTQDDFYASGPGVWIMHDHTEQAVTNKGIGPGGDITIIAYEEFVKPDGLPKTAVSLDRFFDPDFYSGKVPVFDPSIFNTTLSDYEKGWTKPRQPEVGSKAAPVPPAKGGSPPEPVSPAKEESHSTLKLPPIRQRTAAVESPVRPRAVVSPCAKPRSFRRIVLMGGTKVAREGEVYGFDRREIRLRKCEEVEVTLENTDSIRHAFKIPDLAPLFNLEFRGPGKRTARFVTPDEDVTLEFRCNVPGHENFGMVGVIVVGKGGGAGRKL